VLKKQRGVGGSLLLYLSRYGEIEKLFSLLRHLSRINFHIYQKKHLEHIIWSSKEMQLEEFIMGEFQILF